MRSAAITAALLWGAQLGMGAVPIATFDGAAGTTLQWHTVNDPVMGGQSISSFEVDGARHLGIWNGEVKVVPFLGAPGFCNLQTPGLHKDADFPDLSGAAGIAVKLREASASGLRRFNVLLMSKGARHLFQRGVYMANFTVSTAMSSHVVPWSAFQCSWRGQRVSWCPELRTQLKQITSVGLGTAFPGTAGRFRLEIESLSGAVTAGSIAASDGGSPQAHAVDLATFDGKVSHRWHSENDPVMGGRSSSSFVARQGLGEYSGTCRIVPQLQAPGFTIAMTETPLVGRFPDVSDLDGLILGVRIAGGNITDFKAAFCDSRINYYRCQFQSFKADFTVRPGGDFQEVFLPWSKFSDRWSAYTGKHTAEEPPTVSSLRSITQLQIWTEGVVGDFHLQIKYVRAGRDPGTGGADAHRMLSI